MADTDRARRFRPQATEDPAAYIDGRADRRGTPPHPTTGQRPRPAPVQARQDVVDVAAFIRRVDTERGQGRPAPRPQPMQTILGAFHGSPATQATVQILAAAATARHFGGENSSAARKWEKLAQDNAARLEAMRAQQYLQEQSRYVQAQLLPEESDRRINERVAADRETDRRAFDAAGALALSYVAVKSLPPLRQARRPVPRTPPRRRAHRGFPRRGFPHRGTDPRSADRKRHRGSRGGYRERTGHTRVRTRDGRPRHRLRDRPGHRRGRGCPTALPRRCEPAQPRAVVGTRCCDEWSSPVGDRDAQPRTPIRPHPRGRIRPRDEDRTRSGYGSRVLSTPDVRGHISPCRLRGTPGSRDAPGCPLQLPACRRRCAAWSSCPKDGRPYDGDT